MNIVMVGSGYVGLVTGACFADFGHNVTCVDLDQNKIEALQRGEIPIYEPGLSDLVAENARAGRLTFVTELKPAVKAADVVFIAVGTPSRRGDGHADLSYVYAAARSIGEAIDRYTVVVTKSTVPVGTGDEVERILAAVRPQGDFSVVSNPEFLREGAAIEDFEHPDRIVLGIDDERARPVMAEVYRPLNRNNIPILYTARRTAELIKYASNAFLAMKITFINEMADLCEVVGANVQDIAKGIGLDGRIGTRFLNAGPGFGGSCFPKDTLALLKTAQDHESPVRLIEATVAINDSRKRAMSRKVIAACGGDVRDKTIGVLGLTFKPNTDDMRGSPSLSIVQGLLDRGARVRVFDPEGMKQAAELMDGVEFGTGAYEIAEGADAIVIITDWNEFRALDFKRLKETMKQPVLIDLRNVYGRKEMEQHGFRYVSVGRPAETIL